MIAWSPFFADPAYSHLHSHSNSSVIQLQSERVYIPTCISSAQSRRFSELTKICVDLGLRLSQGVEVNHMISSSRHGELGNSSELLKMIGRQEVLSPTLFSQSVHNTALGNLTILGKTRVATTSLSGGRNSFLMGLVSSYVYLQENPQATLLYISGDTEVPEEFSIGLREKNMPFAAAFLFKNLNSETGIKFQFSEIPETESASSDQNSNPQTIDFLRRFLSNYREEKC